MIKHLLIEIYLLKHYTVSNLFIYIVISSILLYPLLYMSSALLIYLCIFLCYLNMYLVFYMFFEIVLQMLVCYSKHTQIFIHIYNICEKLKRLDFTLTEWMYIRSGRFISVCSHCETLDLQP